jgi:hypothetical protein
MHGIDSQRNKHPATLSAEYSDALTADNDSVTLKSSKQPDSPTLALLGKANSGKRKRKDGAAF